MNHQNAHLFLPLVQALAEGKTIQIQIVRDYWKDLAPTDQVLFEYPPSEYRIKPWTPKFKVGDRVAFKERLKIGPTNIIGAVLEVRGDSIKLDNGCWYGEGAFELKPWSLPEPPAGKSWHRNDFTEDMLPEGWRPLLKGEMPVKGDEVHADGSPTWTVFPADRNPKTGICYEGFFYRTRRPLPSEPRIVPLCASDVPPGSFIRKAGWAANTWDAVLAVTSKGVYSGFHVCNPQFRMWEQLKCGGWQILRPGSSTWEACSKEA